MPPLPPATRTKQQGQFSLFEAPLRNVNDHLFLALHPLAPSFPPSLPPSLQNPVLLSYLVVVDLRETPGVGCLPHEFLVQERRFASLQLSDLYCTGMWSASIPCGALIPTRSGLPLRVATSSPGKTLDLKAQAKAPSSCWMAFSTMRWKLSSRCWLWMWDTSLAITSVSVSDSNLSA